MKSHTKSKSNISFNIVNYIMVGIIALWSLSMIYSLFWLLAGSFKDSFEYYTNPFGFPSLEFITAENYSRAINKLYVPIYTGAEPRNVYFLEMLFNSLYITFVSAFLSIFVPAMVAFVSVKCNFKFNKVLQAIVVINIVVPIGASLASQLHVFQMFGLYDNLLGIIVMRWAYIGHNFLYMSGAWKGVSNEYMDAAFIDGAGYFKTFFLIMLPMIKNIFMMFFLLQVIGWWNTWDFTFLYMPSHPNLAQAVYSVQTSSDNQLVIKPVQLAISVLVIIPSLTFFFLFKDQVMQKISFGGLKG